MMARSYSVMGRHADALKAYQRLVQLKPQDAQARDRLNMITGRYKEGIFNQAGGDYWRNLFCWPTAMVEQIANIVVNHKDEPPTRNAARRTLPGNQSRGRVYKALQSCIDAENYSTSDYADRVLAYYTVGGALWPMPFHAK